MLDQDVRARAKEGHEEAMLELRPRFVNAMREAFPALLVSPEAARGIEDGHAFVPEAIEMDGHVAEVLAMDQGEAVDHPAPVA